MPGTDRYTILAEIASGSTATVYLAEDTVLRRKVALKKLHPHLHNHSDMVKRFAKEAVAIAALSHENIIKVFEFGKEERNLYLAMEYIDGMNLEALLKTGEGGLPNLVALSIFRHLLEGLGAAHARGIYHRDIKPSNVLVDRKGCVKLADFGIAFLSGETSFTRTGSYLGTPGYSAPEQADGLAVTDKTDVFAMGILFYRCLTGRLPFDGDTPHAVLRAIMEKDPPKAATVNRRILPGFQELIESMLAKRSEDRPTAVECIERLERLARGPGFFFEPARLARFLEAGDAYRLKEDGEIAECFLARARRFRGAGEIREALKSYALAEAFADAPDDIRFESDALVARLRSGSRKKILAAAGAAVALISVAAIGWSNRPDPVEPIVATSKPPPEDGLEKQVQPAEADAEPDQAADATEIPAVAETSPPAERPAAPIPVPTRKERAGAPGPELEQVVARPASPPAASTQAPGQTSSQAKPKQPAKSVALSGFLMVKTNPPFAKLFVDGMEAGTTPTKSPLEMKPGLHDMVLERKGCRSMHSEFRIAPSETTSLRLVLEPSEGEGF